MVWKYGNKRSKYTRRYTIFLLGKFHFYHLTIVAATGSSTAFNFALITFCGNKVNKCVPFQPNDQSNGSSVKQARKKTTNKRTRWKHSKWCIIIFEGREILTKIHLIFDHKSKQFSRFSVRQDQTAFSSMNLGRCARMPEIEVSCGLPKPN